MTREIRAVAVYARTVSMVRRQGGTRELRRYYVIVRLPMTRARFVLEALAVPQDAAVALRMAGVPAWTDAKARRFLRRGPERCEA